MGSGKSTAGKMLGKHIPVLDLDEVNRGLLEADGEGTNRLEKLDWMPIIDGSIDKAQLSLLMFQDEAKKRQVEAILHPLLWEKMDEWTAQHNICAVEVPLLFETDSQNRFDEVWCVVCDEPVALERLKSGRHIDEDEARRRLANQFDAKYKAEHSDCVIKNNGTADELEARITQLLKERTGE